MNTTNELLRAILKMDEEERLRTQATEEYRRGAQTRLTEAARSQEAEIMAAMRTRMDAFSAREQARADERLAKLEAGKQQALSRMEQLRADKREEWVKTITDRVLGREA